MTEAYPFTGTAVVTGAGSGIGRALAHGLAARGLDLALVDIHQDRLDAVAGELRTGLNSGQSSGQSSGPSSGRTRVTTHRMDVADREAVAGLPGAVAAAHDGPVSMLFNNAGVAVGGRFEQLGEADFDWLMEINLTAPIRLTRAFLPRLREAPAARIVNISSIFGIIAPAGQSAYCAAKFGLRGFSEALRHELEGSSVGVTVVHPGGVNTRIAADARTNGMTREAVAAAKIRAQKSLVMPPDRAARLILKAAGARKGRQLVGADARAAAAIQALFPVRYHRLLRKRLAAADEGRGQA